MNSIPEVVPISDSRSCVYITAHAGRRLEERFPNTKLKRTPFVMFTQYCTSPSERNVWCIPIIGGYIIGRWIVSEPVRAAGQYDFTFVGVTAITEAQFRSSHFTKTKCGQVKVIRVVDELSHLKMKDYYRAESRRLTLQAEDGILKA